MHVETKKHMIHTVEELRKARDEAGISQVKFSEITGLSQQAFSAFELGKAPLAYDELQEVYNVFLNFDDFDGIRSRKKRYQKHVYSEVSVDLERKNRSKSGPNLSA